MLSPEEKKKINRNNYDGYQRDNKTECYLKFSFDSLQELGLERVESSPRNVWIVPKDIPINGNLISSGNTEDGSEGEILYSDGTNTVLAVAGIVVGAMAVGKLFYEIFGERETRKKDDDEKPGSSYRK